MAYAAEIKSDESRKEELIKETVNKLYESPTRSIYRNQNANGPKVDLDKLIELLIKSKTG